MTTRRDEIEVTTRASCSSNAFTVRLVPVAAAPSVMGAVVSKAALTRANACSSRTKRLSRRTRSTRRKESEPPGIPAVSVTRIEPRSQVSECQRVLLAEFRPHRRRTDPWGEEVQIDQGEE